MPRKSVGRVSRKKRTDPVVTVETENTAVLESKAGTSALDCQFDAADKAVDSCKSKPELV